MFEVFLPKPKGPRESYHLQWLPDALQFSEQTQGGMRHRPDLQGLDCWGRCRKSAKLRVDCERDQAVQWLPSGLWDPGGLGWGWGGR